jgi:hypothetical protein
MIMLLSWPGFGATLIATLTASALMVSTLHFPTLRGVGHATSTVLRGDYSRRLRD